MKPNTDPLQRAMDLFPAPERALEQVAERHRNRHRNRRVEAIVVASLVVLAATIVASGALGGAGTASRGIPSTSVGPILSLQAMKNAPPHTVVVVSLDGIQRQKFSALPADVFAPSLSPDGSSLAFVTAGIAGPQLATISSDGSGFRILDVATAANSPVWSPDGSRIAFVGWPSSTSGEVQDGNRDIYVVGADGSHLQRLTTSAADDETPEWSPDGSRLAYASNPTADEFSDQVEIWTVPSAGGAPRRMTHNDVWDAEPTWSPDGSKIAYYSFADSHLWVMEADGSGQHPLVATSAGFFAPQWSPDGSRIVGLGRERRDGSLRVLLLDLATGKVGTIGTLGVHSDWNRVRWMPSGDALLVNRIDD
jgi:Tol biopolymer transport system component